MVNSKFIVAILFVAIAHAAAIDKGARHSSDTRGLSLRQLPSENPPTDPPTDPADPPTDPADPPTDPTDPPTDPTDPPTDPTDPPTDPTDPPTDPTDPPTDPTDPTDPPTDPTDPPTDPQTDPTDPPINPPCNRGRGVLSFLLNFLFGDPLCDAGGLPGADVVNHSIGDADL